MKNLNKYGRIIVFAIVPFFVFVVVNFVYEPFERHNKLRPISLADFSNAGIVRMDTETILASLKQGGADVFVSEAEPDLDAMWEGPELYPGSIPWTQSDYLAVAFALNSFVWNDDMREWNLFLMNFSTTCKENVKGFRRGQFFFFKSKFDKGKLVYSWRSITITPGYKNAVWGEGDFPPPLFGWKKINLDQLKVSADDVLRIAEENGGKDARLEIENKCGSSATLLPDNWNGWWVNIGGSFEIYIAPNTGRIISR